LGITEEVQQSINQALVWHTTPAITITVIIMDPIIIKGNRCGKNKEYVNDVKGEWRRGKVKVGESEGI